MHITDVQETNKKILTKCTSTNMMRTMTTNLDNNNVKGQIINNDNNSGSRSNNSSSGVGNNEITTKNGYYDNNNKSFNNEEGGGGVTGGKGGNLYGSRQQGGGRLKFFKGKIPTIKFIDVLFTFVSCCLLSSFYNSPSVVFYFALSDGKFILEIEHASNGEKMSWVSVPRKTFWPPQATAISTPFKDTNNTLSGILT